MTAHGPQWFKLATSFFSNRKVILAGRDGRDVFLAVLTLNGARGGQGFIPIGDWDSEYLAHMLRIPVTEAVTGMERAISAGLVVIEGDHVAIVGWDEHWAARPKTRAEIQKNYRERHKTVTESAVTQSNALPALPIDREIDRERGRGNAPGSLSRNSARSGGSSEPRKGREEGQPLPDGWQPDPEAVELARGLGLDPAHEAAQFVDDSRAKGRTYLDANAAFRKWCRGSRDKGKHKPPKPGAVTARQREDVVFTEQGAVPVVRSEQRANSADIQQGSEPGRKR